MASAIGSVSPQDAHILVAIVHHVERVGVFQSVGMAQFLHGRVLLLSVVELVNPVFVEVDGVLPQEGPEPQAGPARVLFAVRVPHLRSLTVLEVAGSMSTQPFVPFRASHLSWA